MTVTTILSSLVGILSGSVLMTTEKRKTNGFTTKRFLYKRKIGDGKDFTSQISCKRL